MSITLPNEIIYEILDHIDYIDNILFFLKIKSISSVFNNYFIDKTKLVKKIIISDSYYNLQQTYKRNNIILNDTRKQIIINDFDILSYFQSVEKIEH